MPQHKQQPLHVVDMIHQMKEQILQNLGMDLLGQQVILYPLMDGLGDMQELVQLDLFFVMHLELILTLFHGMELIGQQHQVYLLEEHLFREVLEHLLVQYKWEEMYLQEVIEMQQKSLILEHQH